MSDKNHCGHCGDVSWSDDTHTYEDGHVTHYSETMRHSHEADGGEDHYTLLQFDESGNHGSKSDDIHIDILDMKEVGDTILIDMRVH